MYKFWICLKCNQFICSARALKPSSFEAIGVPCNSGIQNYWPYDVAFGVAVVGFTEILFSLAATVTVSSKLMPTLRKATKALLLIMKQMLRDVQRLPHTVRAG